MTLTPEFVRPDHCGERREYRCGGLWIAFDQIAPSTRGLDAWVEVRWTDDDPPRKDRSRYRLLHIGRMDLMGARTSSTIKAAVKEGVRAKGEWQEIVVAIVNDVVQDHLAGPEPEFLTGIVGPDTESRWMLPPLVGGSRSTSLIAPGGSTKSFIALACGLTVVLNRTKFLQMKPRTTGPVIMCDWEADRKTHDMRVAALCAAHGIDPPTGEMFPYFEMRGVPLYRRASSLAKQVARRGAVMVIIDSVMLARGAGGDSGGADTTIRFYQSLAQLGVPTLLVDHKSREAIREKLPGAYGSVVNDNTARLQWEIVASEDQGPNRVLMKLRMEKRNNMGRMPPIGLEARFRNEGEGSAERLVSASFTQIDPGLVVPFAGDGDSPTDLVRAELRLAGEEGLLVRDLRELTGKKENQVRNVLSDLKKMGKVMERQMGRAKRWYFADAVTQQGFEEPEEDPY